MGCKQEERDLIGALEDIGLILVAPLVGPANSNDLPAIPRPVRSSSKRIRVSVFCTGELGRGWGSRERNDSYKILSGWSR